MVKGAEVLYLSLRQKLSLINNTIVNNESTGLFIGHQSRVFGLNNIVYGNIKSIELDSTSICDMGYSNIENSFPGKGNINQIPKFISPTVSNKTSAYNYNADFNLNIESPSRNSGYNILLFNDSDGSVNDMGFTGGRGLFPSSLNLSFPSVAIETSNNGSISSSNKFTFYNCSDNILNLSCFTFSSPQFKLAGNTSTFTIMLQSLVSVNLLFQPNNGGFDSSKVTIDIQTADMNTSLDVQLIGKANNYTILSGNLSGRLKIDNSPYLLTNYAAVQNGSILIIDPGVKIYANENCGFDTYGTLIAEGSPQSNILFSASDKAWNGIYLIQGNSSLKYCVIEKTQNWGIQILGGNILIENCRITHNAIHGIIIESSANPIIRGSIIDNNSAWGIYVRENSTPEIYNNTISKNSSGILMDGNSKAIIKNNIIWGNNSSNVSSWSIGDSELSYNCIQGNFPSFALDKGNNKYLDPQFVNLAQDDFHLSSTSPYIDSGTNNIPSTFYADFESKQRIYDGNNDGITNIDLGAFEFGAPDIIILPPLKPALIYPQNDVKNLPLDLSLKWEDIQNCNLYNLQISKANTFNPLIIDTVFYESTKQIKLYENGTKYYWRVRGNNVAGYGGWSDVWSFTTAALVNVDEEKIPTEYSLSQNYPNPFNPTTKIKFGLPENTLTKLIIYDILGREVLTLVNQELDAGYHEVKLDASKLSSGVYFYRLQARLLTQMKKLMLMK